MQQRCAAARAANLAPLRNEVGRVAAETADLGQRLDLVADVVADMKLDAAETELRALAARGYRVDPDAELRRMVAADPGGSTWSGHIDNVKAHYARDPRGRLPSGRYEDLPESDRDAIKRIAIEDKCGLKEARERYLARRLGSA